jgi:hypothetical protein
MTDNRNHDEIASRLRETGTVPAPDRLRGEVMSQVRAEPRLGRSPRSFLTPVLPYAAAAAVLAALVIAISHLDIGSTGSSSGGAGASVGGAAARSPEVSGGGALDRLGGQHVFHLAPSEAQQVAQGAKVTATRSPRAIVIAVPPSVYADYRKRLTELERRSPAGPTIRVILRRVP